MNRKVVPAVLVYVHRDDEILMIHRASKDPGRVDFHEGKWNGLGGKCEVDESPLQAVHRELWEESGLDLPLESFTPLGVLQFPNFKPHKSREKSEDWIVFIFTVHLKSGNLDREPLTENCEGTMSWIPTGEILNLNLWPGDREFIPHVLASRPFMGTIWYEASKVREAWIQVLGRQVASGMDSLSLLLEDRKSR